MADAASGGLANISQQLNDLKVKYYAMAPRDRVALTALSVFLVGVLFYYVAWSPINNKATASYDRYQNKLQLLAWMKANDNSARLAAKSGGVSIGSREGKSILSLVNATSKQNGISLKRFEPKGEEGLRIWLENVPFDNMLKWLDTLNLSYGISVANISVETQKEAGLVNATIVLSG